MSTTNNAALCRRNRRLARQKWGLGPNHPLLPALKSLTEDFVLSVSATDVILLQNGRVDPEKLMARIKQNPLVVLKKFAPLLGRKSKGLFDYCQGSVQALSREID